MVPLLQRIAFPSRQIISCRRPLFHRAKNRHHHHHKASRGSLFGTFSLATLSLSIASSSTSSSSFPLATTTTRLAGKEEDGDNTAEASPKKRILFVWDFDWTVVNCNSDEYIPAQFFPNEETLSQEFSKLYKQHNKDWHACVERMVATARVEYGATQSTLLAAARRMPYLTGVRQALDLIHNNNKQPSTTSQMILSDGNTLFIHEFLQANELAQHFDSGVISNIGKWVDDKDNSSNDLLLLVEHQSAQYGGHDCPTCPANLCKTQALRHALPQTFPKDNDRPRIVYVGDGSNDACPALQVLGTGDVLLARVGHKRAAPNRRQGIETDAQAMEGQAAGGRFGIEGALQRATDKGEGPKCTVKQWYTGDELRSLVEQVLEESSSSSLEK